MIVSAPSLNACRKRRRVPEHRQTTMLLNSMRKRAFGWRMCVVILVRCRLPEQADLLDGNRTAKLRFTGLWRVPSFMRHTLSLYMRNTLLLTAAVACLLAEASIVVKAQSSDAGFPTPVYSGEVAGRITPRDFGDARRTSHFYTFKSTEGDLSLTVEASDLTGDVDIFTAASLRPLLKVTLYGGATRTTKSVYLRNEETLILRVEARTIGDTDGRYTVRLGGSFAPAPAGIAEGPAPVAPSTASAQSRDGGVRRVTSTGARIEEPVDENAAGGNEAGDAARPPARVPATASKGRTTTGTRETPARRASRDARSASSATRRRGATPAPSKTTTGTPSTTGVEASGGSTAERTATGPAGDTTTASRPAPSRRARAPRTSNRSAAAGRGATSREPEAARTPAPGRRLVIVTRDGETLERDMSTVRRVTVENNQLVILMRDGKTLKQPMSGVLRMSIEP